MLQKLLTRRPFKVEQRYHLRPGNSQNFRELLKNQDKTTNKRQGYVSPQPHTDSVFACSNLVQLSVRGYEEILLNKILPYFVWCRILTFQKVDKLLLIYLKLAISLKITTPMISGFENKVIPNLECQGGKCVEGLLCFALCQMRTASRWNYSGR